MHILFLSDNFPPEVNAPASRTFEHCREWVRAGHRVTVITCAPNFPTGRVFAGYHNRVLQRERIDGIEVLRVWSYITANEGFLRRSIDYASYMASAVFASPIVRRVDVVIGTSPQFFTAPAAWIVSAIKGKPFVFELRDLWPEAIRAVGALHNKRILSWLERLELFLYRKARAVVAVTESFKDDLTTRGIDSTKIRVVTNGVDLFRFTPGPKDKNLLRKLRLQGKLVVGYVGTHGMAHALHTVLEAADLVRKCPSGYSIHILFLGNGACRNALKSQAAAQGLDNVSFIDTVPKEQVALYWSLLDIAIIHLKKADLFKTVIPSKLFESMAMGIPVLHGVMGESARIVEVERVGLLFEPENAQDLCEKLLFLAANPTIREDLGRQGRRAAFHFDRTLLARQMLKVLEEVATVRGGVPQNRPEGSVATRGSAAH